MAKGKRKLGGKEGGKGTGLIARFLVPVVRFQPTIAVHDYVGHTTGARSSDKEKLIFVPFRDQPYWSILYRPTLTQANDEDAVTGFPDRAVKETGDVFSFTGCDHYRDKALASV
eukprot:6207885-Pleurochrysis_carterae.AAC.1